jgi:hypothetical protein
VPTPTSEAAQVWSATKDTSSAAVLEAFIRQYGKTPYGALARARLEEVRANQVAVVAPPAARPPVPETPPPASGGARTLAGSEIWVSFNPAGEAAARRVIERLKSLGVRVLEDPKKAGEREDWDRDLDHGPKDAALAREVTAAVGDIYRFNLTPRDSTSIVSLWVTPKAAPAPQQATAPVPQTQYRSLQGSEVWVSFNPKGDATARKLIQRLKSLGVRVLEDRKKAGEHESWDRDLDHDPKHAALVRELVAATGDIYKFKPKKQDGRSLPSLWVTPR